jgi:lipoprotein-releasing system permease protein
LNLAAYIVKHIAFSEKRNLSAFIIRVAIAAVALSMAVMVVTTATVNGFQQEISRKIFGFWGHIHISGYDLNYSYEDLTPISTQQNFYPALDTVSGIKHIQVYARKAGIIKTENDIEGIMLKGIGADFDWQNFERFLQQGKTLNLSDSTKSNDILISQTTAKRLHLGIDSSLVIYFVQETPRVRKFKVGGIYKTGLEEYDEKYALIDIRHVQKLNGWTNEQVGGFEISLDNMKDLDQMTELIHYDIEGDLKVQSMKEINPNIFEWLALQNTNEQLILGLMLFVAIINMATALLILILERTNMIGILKALGATNRSIAAVFLYNAALIVGLGIVLGNIIGLALCWLQHRFGFITLDEESYYIHTAPIEVNWQLLLWLNIGTLLLSIVVLLIPAYFVTRIEPIKAIKFK